MFIDLKNFPSPPQRIISLVPSITELLYTLGLNDETIGITKFCIHPSHWFKQKEKIGGTKNINIQKIKNLKPDLVICNKEENVKEQVEEIAKEYPVYMSDVNSYTTALAMINDIGQITKRQHAAQEIVNKIESRFNQLQIIKSTHQKAAYLIWKDPYMTIGGDTFINDLLIKLGLQNIYKHQSRYPQITLEALQRENPEVIFLSTEPYPFKETHVAHLKELFPVTKILLVDGEMFSWYGSRMMLMPQYFKNLLLILQES